MDLSGLSPLKNDMEKCFRCSLCKMVPLPVVRDPRFTDGCPASRLFHFHGYSGSGKQIMALSLLEGRVQADKAMARIAFACTACGYCDVACKFIMDAERHRVNMALREYLVEAGLAPPEHREQVQNLEEATRLPQKQLPSPGSWAQGLGLKVLPEQEAQVLLFAGCVPQESPRAVAVVRKLARLLVHAGVDVGILGDREPCCGLPAYWRGFSKDFKKTAENTASLLDDLGVSTIVVASGSCLGAFRSKYPEYARAPRAKILHASEFLAGLIDVKCLRLPRPVRTRVTYHDPCYLGRQSEPFVPWEGEEKTSLGCMTYTDPPKPISRGTGGVYSAPRRILKSIRGIDFTEMYRIREYSFCCGAGGGVPDAVPELGIETALHRLAEARAVGAEQLVTSCAHCLTHLEETQRDQQAQTPSQHLALMPVLDLVELVFKASGLEE